MINNYITMGKKIVDKILYYVLYRQLFCEQECIFLINIYYF